MAKTNIDVSNGWPIADCVFCVDRTGVDVNYCITPKPYWNDAKCLHDCFDEVVGLPRGFHNTEESCWSYGDGTTDRSDLLIAAGCQHSPAMDKYINNYQV